MALPSQSARSPGIPGRSFSSRRRRRRKLGNGAVAFVGFLVLAGVVYGGLWAFGVVGGDAKPEDTRTALKPSGDDAGDQLEPIVINQGVAGNRSTGQPSRTPVVTDTNRASRDTEPVAEDEAPVRRNLLREGLANARNVGGSDSAGPKTSEPIRTVGDREKGGAVLATNENTGSESLISGTAAAVAAKLTEADRLLKSNRPLAAREVLNDALHAERISEDEAAALRTKLGQLNEDLVFSPRVVEGDPMCEVYEIQPGDRLSKIASRRELAVHWKLIQRVNGISDPNRIRVGQKLKLVRGPFHAVIDKSDFRIDIYHGQPNDPDHWLYIRSFDVGLGKDDGTPLGTFVVARNSKVINPAWVNPHNPAEKYGRDDPRNPIGEYWIGLEGLGDSSAFIGYGIHGTIEPQSIGQQASLGCVRLGAKDIEQVYELLVEGISIVKIVP